MIPALALAASLVLVAAAAPQAQGRRTWERSELSGAVALGRPPGAARGAGGGPARFADRDATRNAGPQNETTIAVDPANPLNLVVGTNDFRSGEAQAGVAVSFDGGWSWSSTTLADLDPALGKYAAQADPWVAAMPGGVFFYSFIDFNRDDEQNRLCVARSTDGGATFGPPLVISDEERFNLGAYPAVGPGGEVYVAWKHASSLRIDRSLDGGVTFGADVTLAEIAQLPDPLPGSLFRVRSFPSLAVALGDGPDRGNLYVAWADAGGPRGGPDGLLARSIDRGASWSAPLAVSDDPVPAYQWMPAIGVAKDGVLTVAFSDEREHVATGRYDVHASQSLDGA